MSKTEMLEELERRIERAQKDSATSHTMGAELYFRGRASALIDARDLLLALSEGSARV